MTSRKRGRTRWYYLNAVPLQRLHERWSDPLASGWASGLLRFQARVEGRRMARIEPSMASWDPRLGEFALLYSDVRKAASPRDAILEFCESTYAAGARLRDWDPGLVAERSA